MQCAARVAQLTYPLDTLRLRLAVDPSVVGMRGAVRVLLREGAGPAFYRGIGVACLGASPAPRPTRRTVPVACASTIAFLVGTAEALSASSGQCQAVPWASANAGSWQACSACYFLGLWCQHVLCPLRRHRAVHGDRAGDVRSPARRDAGLCPRLLCRAAGYHVLLSPGHTQVAPFPRRDSTAHLLMLLPPPPPPPPIGCMVGCLLVAMPQITRRILRPAYFVVAWAD